MPGELLMTNGQPNPTGRGRYCLPEGTCYCGGCPQYRPLPGVDSPEYAALVRTARREAAEKAERRKGRRR